MPSHSPYALSSLTFLLNLSIAVLLELHKFRVLFEIDSLPFRKNLFRFASFYLRGLTNLFVFSSLTLIYHRLLHYLVFKVQYTHTSLCVWWR